MPVEHPLSDLSDLFNLSELYSFTHNILVERVEPALSLSDKASIRRRWLPSDQGLVALMNMRSHIILFAQSSPYRRVALPQADTFIGEMPDHSITLRDKGLWCADLLLRISQQDKQRHWRIPERKT